MEENRRHANKKAGVRVRVAVWSCEADILINANVVIRRPVAKAPPQYVALFILYSRSFTGSWAAKAALVSPSIKLD